MEGSERAVWSLLLAAGYLKVIGITDRMRGRRDLKLNDPRLSSMNCCDIYLYINKYILAYHHLCNQVSRKVVSPACLCSLPRDKTILWFPDFSKYRYIVRKVQFFSQQIYLTHRSNEDRIFYQKSQRATHLLVPHQ